MRSRKAKRCGLYVKRYDAFPSSSPHRYACIRVSSKSKSKNFLWLTVGSER